MDFDIGLLCRMPLRIQMSIAKKSAFALSAFRNYWKDRPLNFNNIHNQLSQYDYSLFVLFMRNHIKSLHLDAGALLETLVPLEKLGVTRLESVTETQIDAVRLTVPQWELAALPVFLPNLKSLTVRFDITIDFISMFTKLEFLQIEAGMSTHAIDAICQKCVHLKTLRVFEVDNKLSLRTINCSQTLQNVYIGINTYRTWSQSVLAIPNLKELNIYRYDICSETIAHWLEIIKDLLNSPKASKIRVFKIDATSLTYEEWQNFVTLYKCERLQYLGLYHCNFKYISPALCCANPTIEIICLNGCKNLRGAQIVALIEKCSLLRILCLSDCYTMNREVIESIVRARSATKKSIKICYENYVKTELELRWQYNWKYSPASLVMIEECQHSNDNANRADKNQIYVKFDDV